MSYLKIAIVECSITPDDPPDDTNDSTDTDEPSIASAANRLTCAAEGWDHFTSRVSLPSNCTATAFAFLLAEGSEEWGRHDLAVVISAETVILDATELHNALGELIRSEKRLVIGPLQGAVGHFRYVCWRPRDRHIQKLFVSLTADLSPKMTISPDTMMRELRTNISLETNSRLAAILRSIDNKSDEDSTFSRFASRLLIQLASPHRHPPKTSRHWDRRFSYDLKNEVERALGDRMSASLFEYEREGYDRRAIEFRPDGSIGIGGAVLEQYWDVEVDMEGKAVLSISSSTGVTCELQRLASGDWRGKWLICEAMPVSIRPIEREEMALLTVDGGNSLHDFSVRQQFPTLRPNAEYDLTVAVLVHCSEKYRGRAEAFLRGGLVNVGKHRVHVVYLGSIGDERFAAKFYEECDGRCSFTFLEMSSSCPVPKINGYYLWMLGRKLDSRWYVRVDDDSVTDVTALLRDLDPSPTQRVEPVHYMTHPMNGEPTFERFLNERNIRLTSILREYESSVTSHAAMLALQNNAIAVDFLRDTAAHIAAPGDVALALALQMCSVRLANNPNATKDRRQDSFSLLGGKFHHIHYVDWNDPFLVHFIAFIDGAESRRIEDADIDAFTGRSLIFVRGLGEQRGSIWLASGGSVESGGRMMENAWFFNGATVTLRRPSLLCTLVFDRRLDSPNFIALVGKDCLNGETVTLLCAVPATD